MIFFEMLRQGAEIDCRQCDREKCATGQTLLANLILAVHNLSLFLIYVWKPMRPLCNMH
jgi:hypothetical protein